MAFKKIIGKIHLWLGLVSGLLVFIIAITGCLYAFQDEIQNLTQPYRFVKEQDKPFLPPSKLITIANKELPGKHLHAILYKGPTGSAQAIYYSQPDDYYYTMYINPYTGEVLEVKDMENGFFPFILEGHFYLWLPKNIGQPVVATATLVFVGMVISGLILWFKRKKGKGGQRFKIKWNARWRRINYDLHNVPGFYVSVIALFFAFTGLVWGFEWFNKAYYASVSGGKTFVNYYDPISSRNAKVVEADIPSIDKVWLKMLKEYPAAQAVEVHVPETDSSSISANANPDASTYWKTDYRYFDQYTLKELPVNHLWGRSKNNTTAETLMKMNYDIHVGAILGLPGKILAFCSSLLIATLPITGILIWWGRKKKSKKEKVVNSIFISAIVPGKVRRPVSIPNQK